MEKNNFVIPASIIIAGVIIALAVFYSVGGGKQANNPAPTAAVAALPEITTGDFVLGDAEAPVTIIEYGDFQCPFCGKFFKEAEQMLRGKYVASGKVKFIYRDFAFLGQESTWASEAARCAAEQGRFWETHDYLYSHQNGENQGAFSKDNLKKFALALGLDAGKFNACLDSEKYVDTIKTQTAGGSAAGVKGTPTSFINGTPYVGALPSGQFEQIIEEALKK